EVQVPLGAVLDDGGKTGVWLLDSATSTVRFRPVKILRVSSETAVVSGLSSGDRVVSLGAHLLQEGDRVRTASENRGHRCASIFPRSPFANGPSRCSSSSCWRPPAPTHSSCSGAQRTPTSPSRP